jgi:hypothetical protein
VYWVFPRGKERPGRDAVPSPPSSAFGHERVELYLYTPYGPYGLYRASVPVQGCNLRFLTPYNRPWRPWRTVDVHLYSFFNLDARWVWLVHVTSFVMGVFTCSMEVFRFPIPSPAERSVVIKPEGHALSYWLYMVQSCGDEINRPVQEINQIR